MSKGRKPTHPIRRMRQSIECEYPSAPLLLDESRAAVVERRIARHVTPLLDALEYQPHIPAHGDYCLGCDADSRRKRLLAAWRAPL